MRVDVVVRGVVDDLWDWCEHHAQVLDLTPAEYVGLLIDKERRKVEGLPRQDPRTRRVGRRGSESRMQSDQLTTSDVAALLGLAPSLLNTWGAPGSKRGIFGPGPNKRGQPRVYDGADVLCGAVAATASDLGRLTRIPAKVYDKIRDRYPKIHDYYVIIGTGGCELVNLDRLVPSIKASGGLAVISLEGCEMRWRDKLVA